MAIIALLGGTGRSGLPFIQQALDRGHTVKALVRTPSKATLQHPNLTWVSGDATRYADIESLVVGTDAVVSLIGQVKGAPDNLQSQATEYILKAMRKHRVERLISLTGGGVRDPEHDQPGFMDKVIVFIMKNLAGKLAKHALLDGIAHREVLTAADDIQWTIVRGPMLTEDDAKGSYQVGHVGTVRGIKLTRQDLATFMLDELEQGKYIHEMPFVVN